MSWPTVGSFPGQLNADGSGQARFAVDLDGITRGVDVEYQVELFRVRGPLPNVPVGVVSSPGERVH